MGNRIPISDEVLEEVIEPESILPTFSESLVPQNIILGETTSWVLPEVISGSVPLKRVEVVPDFLLKNFIEYDDETRTVEFSGVKTIPQLKTKVFGIKITLVDEDGSKNEYT